LEASGQQCNANSNECHHFLGNGKIAEIEYKYLDCCQG